MRRCGLLLAAGLAAGTGCAAPRPATTPGSPPEDSVPPAMGPIDHVTLGIRELDAGIAELQERTGVTPALGGSYLDLGLRDALVSLGTDTYLEVLAPERHGRATPARFDALRTYAWLTPFGWAVAVADLGRLRAQLQARGVRTSTPEWGRRDLPDSSRVEWRTVRVLEPADPLLPEFVQWDATSSHPAATSPSGCRLQSLVLETPHPDPLRAMLQQLGVSVPVVQAPLPRVVVKLSCAGQDVEFR